MGLSSIVGFAVVLQQTPLAIIGAPPSEIMFPPLTAVLYRTDETAIVLSVGILAGDNDENDISPL